MFGPRLYHSLPKYLRDIERVKTEKFEFELDKFLELTSVEPKMPKQQPMIWIDSIPAQVIRVSKSIGLRDPSK